jgi:AmmeMemoRadiSam system protein B
MVPHAGLIYSGRLAAAVLNRLEFPEQIIVIGPKHTRYGLPWAVAPHQTWAIPGASIPTDLELARKLVAGIPGLKLDAAAHEQEHAIEIELPLLTQLAPQSRVVGIAIGAATFEQCCEIAAGLARVIAELQPRPLLLISSDMNHFADDAENRRLDQLALKAMQSLDPRQLFDVVRSNEISMCGVLPAVIVMETLRQLGGLTQYESVGYATSADVSRDKSRVVGYAGVLLR